jgi:competence protein ComEC
MATQPASPPTPATSSPVDHAVHLPKFMPFFWLALATLLGILAADLIPLTKLTWLILLGVCLAVWLIPLLIKRGIGLFTHRSLISRLPIIVLVACFCLGAWRLSTSQVIPNPSHVAWYNGKGLVEFQGLIVQPPDERDTYTNLTIQIESLTPIEMDPVVASPAEVGGKLLLRTLPGTEYHYGQRINVRGVLQTPPEGSDFSYRDYLARKGILSLMSYGQIKVLEENAGSPILSAIYRLKDRSQATLQAIFPSPESDLLNGILLGNDKGLSSELKAAYNLTGTAHIIAISGFNIALLAGLITSLLNRALGPRNGAITAIVILALYTILVGAQASVVRAAIMGSFAMLGSLLGRRNNGLNTLGITALAMCLLNPNLPWDIGFQLSFMATLGLVLYGKPFEAYTLELIGKRLKPDTLSRLAAPLSEFLLFTLIAQTLVLPLLAYHFSQLSWLFLIANPLILFLQPPLMIFGGVALLGGLIAPWLGKVLGFLAWPFAAYTNRMVTWLAALFPNTLSLGRFNFSWVVLYYIVLFALTFIHDRKAFLKRVAKPTAVLVPLGCAVLVLWSMVMRAPNGRLTLTMLPGAKNPVVLVESPGGRFVLINGAVDASSLREHLGKFLPFGYRRLDMLVIPSCKLDDVSGLVGLTGRVKISQVVWACDPERIQTTRQLYLSFEDADVPQTSFVVGDQLDLGNGALITLVGSVDNSSVFDLAWEDFGASLVIGEAAPFTSNDGRYPNLWILPGDLKEGALPSTVPPSLLLTWLTIDPDSLPISGDPAISEHLYGVPTLRSDQAGWLRLATDGQQVWLSAQKAVR